MARPYWFRIGRNGRAEPTAFAGWCATIGLVAVELVGTFLLVISPRMFGEPIGWDRGIGWLVLGLGNIAFFILLVGARTQPDTERPGGSRLH